MVRQPKMFTGEWRAFFPFVFVFVFCEIYVVTYSLFVIFVYPPNFLRNTGISINIIVIISAKRPPLLDMFLPQDSRNTLVLHRRVLRGRHSRSFWPLALWQFELSVGISIQLLNLMFNARGEESSNSELYYLTFCFCFRKQCQGRVYVNGRIRNNRWFRRRSCYILQDDKVQDMLTIQESLTIAAELKLGNHISSEQKKTRVSISFKCLSKNRRWSSTTA